MHKDRIFAPGADGPMREAGMIEAGEVIGAGGMTGVIGADGANGREPAPGIDGRERARGQHMVNESAEKVSAQAEAPHREGFSGTSESAEKVSARLPRIDCWQGLSAQEREYRSIKLLELERRIQADGPHQAQPNAQRARQFMPFAALKGYHELAHSKERWDD